MSIQTQVLSALSPDVDNYLESIAGQTGCEIDQVKRALRQLVRNGIVEVTANARLVSDRLYRSRQQRLFPDEPPVKDIEAIRQAMHA